MLHDLLKRNCIFSFHLPTVFQVYQKKCIAIHFIIFRKQPHCAVPCWVTPKALLSAELLPLLNRALYLWLSRWRIRTLQRDHCFQKENEVKISVCWKHPFKVFAYTLYGPKQFLNFYHLFFLYFCHYFR